VRLSELPIFDEAGNPSHHRGVVAAAAGLYFLGLPFQSTPTSDHVGGSAGTPTTSPSTSPANPGVAQKLRASSPPGTRRGDLVTW
jgi:hypothetical protein